MKICWLTDTHLDALNAQARQAFYAELGNTIFDCLIMTGDIAEGPLLIPILHEIAQVIKCPVYFVLGNHDYSGLEIAKMRQSIEAFCLQHPHFHWLRSSGGQKLTSDTLVFGVDGWIDLRNGDYTADETMRFYYQDIPDLNYAVTQSSHAFLSKIQALADEDVNMLTQQLTIGLRETPANVVILTHVPPFAQSCRRDAKPCDKVSLPYFTCKAMGERLIEVARHYPQVNFRVLCGHTHNHCIYQASSNLKVVVGAAKTGAPRIQPYLDLEQLFSLAR